MAQCKCHGVGCFRCACDGCGKPNDRASFSSQCTTCGAGYQSRIALDPEQRPVGAADPRRGGGS